MKKKWLWLVSSFWSSFWVIGAILPLHPLLSSEQNPKQQLLFQKRHKKIEHRLERNKEKKSEYFFKKKMLLDRKYALKQKRLFKKKRLPQKQYAKIETNIQKWYHREIKQLTYQEEKFKKRVARHEERLTHFR